MEEKIRKKLYIKLENEYRNFIEDMKTNEPEVIACSAYEITIKDKLVSILYPENSSIDIDNIKVLNKSKNPLEKLYQECINYDGDINQVLEDSVNNTLKVLAENQKEKNQKIKKKEKER